MTERINAQQLRKQFLLMYNNVDFRCFVEQILDAQFRNGDSWQYEKWENFQKACASILRLPEECLQRILDYEIED